WVKAAYFEMKVVHKREKNGSYFAFPTVEAAVLVHGNVRCPRCAAGKADPRGSRRASAASVREIAAPQASRRGRSCQFLVNATPGLVEAWSAMRLNFLPKDWRESLRAEIETGVSQLCAGKGERLRAEYIAAERGTFDTENVLFFNVDQAGRPFAACVSG